MKRKRRLKKGMKRTLIIFISIVLFICAYPYLNSIELTEDGSLIINRNNNTDDSIYDSVSSEKSNVGTIKVSAGYTEQQDYWGD